MSKRKILVDGEVKLVSFDKWLNLRADKSATDLVTPKDLKAKLSIKDVQVETDPINLELNEQDQDKLEE